MNEQATFTYYVPPVTQDKTKDWLAVPTEQWREYVTKEGNVYRIDSPVRFHVSERGTHYILDREGVVHMLMKEQFTAVRLFDKNGLSYTAPRDIK